MILFQKSFNDPKPLHVDFKRKWWSLIADQRWLFLIVISSIMATNIFWVLTPFFIEIIFNKASTVMTVCLFACWVAIDYLNFCIRWFNGRFQLRCIHGIYQSAHQHLLTIDPLYHTHRSSGAVLAKIERGARGYEQLLDEITFEFVPLLAGLIVMTIALSRYSFFAMIAILALLVIMIGCSYYFAYYGSKQREMSFIKTDDEFKATSVENLAQIQLVRASFATDYMNNKLIHKIENNMRSERSLWFFYASAAFVLNMFYLGSIFVLLSVLLWQIKQGMTSYASALGLAIAYIQSTRSITRITSPLRRYMRSYSAINDLFQFMSSFGKQGFPVLEMDQDVSVDKSLLKLNLEKVTFNYETAQLFNDCSLNLECKLDQPYKLYGIIGASGTGKSTLLSLIGGQIKPTKGSVFINNLDIYAINDATRRSLIALQGQIATSMRGTIRYNLLFGLPDNHGITDQKLLEILERVGLLIILQAHKGLDTMLGEGGLSLSGGQRQRLNFAGLYLRSSFYRPLVILIDEPTSSLDDVSEAAITEMIMELAKNAITLVIAHRLRTIAQAIGIIDLSLVEENDCIKIYTAKELEKKSSYYQELIQGKVTLEE